MAALHQRHFFFQAVFQFQVNLPHRRDLQLQLCLPVPVGRGRNIWQLPLLHCPAVLGHFIKYFHIVLQVVKVHVIVEYQFPAALLIGYCPCRAVDIFIFQQPGMGCTVRVYQPIHAEVAVMDCFPMVAAVQVHRFPIPCLPMCNCMVAPFPDKAPAHPVVALDHLEIILKIPWPVSHAVAVFHQQEGLAPVFFQIFRNLRQRRVHPAVQVQIPIPVSYAVIAVSGAFILRQPARVKGFCPFQRFLKIAAIGAFIPH